jgi:hypothetical protein
MQFVKWNSPSFVYVHLKAGRREQVARETMMHRLRPRVWLSVTSILVGDFSCIIHLLDMRDAHFAVLTSALCSWRPLLASFFMWTPVESSIPAPRLSPDIVKPGICQV